MQLQSLDQLERSDSPQEKCGICGVYGKGFEAARLVYFGLWALQHRGQESSGISSSDGKIIRTHKGEGLVAHVYKEEDLEWLEGHIAIGHNRYGTSGGKGKEHAQPIVGRDGNIALAHNGNLPSTKKLQEFLKKNHVKIEGMNDSELMQKVLQYYLNKGNSIEKAVEKAFPLFTGAFCLVILTKNKLVAIRDCYGIRPLSLGKINGGYMVASETCAFDTVGATFVRDIKPGEMIVIDRKGIHQYQLAKGEQKLDIFEFIYFARPDSVLLGKDVNEVRRNLGKQLALEYKTMKADVVIPVPDSAIPASLGFSQGSGIPFDHGFVKNRYIHRTFIRPDQHLRERDVSLKLKPLSFLKGKRVIVIDDSIVRGTTSKKIVDMVRSAGAKKVYMLISSPPVKYPDFYGIDTPVQKDLIAAHKSIKEIETFIGADRLGYLSYNGLLRAIGLPEELFCTACLNGKYPISLEERVSDIDFSK